jgi:glycosyltransferase involved in cell wall biosynthesis
MLANPYQIHERDMSRPSMAFATMCKNEEHCIRQTLDAVAPYIDYLVVCDTGSTDRTVEIVKEFMEETGIPGEIRVDEWVGFDHNKNIMMQSVFNKSDYLLHVDADDILAGDFSFKHADRGHDLYLMTLKRGKATWKATVVYNNRLRWKFCGVAHTIIKCLDRENLSTGDLSDRGWIIADGIGSRAFDPKKYLYDAEKLTKQFWDTIVYDPDGLNIRSVFYTAQSYGDYGMYEEALKWNTLYLKMKDTWIEEVFEAQIRVANCMMKLNYHPNRIIAEMHKAFQIFQDRAEPLYDLGQYLNVMGRFEEAYGYLKRANECSLEKAQRKYTLFINTTKYGSHVKDELSVSCYWLGKYEEGYSLLMEIIDDPDYQEYRERLLQNQIHFQDRMKGVDI